MGGGTGRSRGDGRLGRRRDQGRAAARRPAADDLRRRRCGRADRGAAVRAGQPRQAQRRARPAQRRRARRRWTACWPTPTCSSPTRGSPRWSGWGSIRTRCASGSRRSSTASSPGTGWRVPTPTDPATTSGAFWARSTLASSVVPRGALPPPIRGGFGDHVTGMTLAGGICGALFDRERTGRGHLVSTSLLRTGLYCAGWDLGVLLRFGKLESTRARHEARTPLVNCYAAADGAGFWLLGLESDRHWPALVAALDRPDLAADERFATARTAPRALRGAGRRARRRLRLTGDGRLGGALRRARRVVGADQQPAHRARRPAGRGVRRVRRDVRRRRRDLARRSPARSTSTTRSNAPAPCPNSASTTPRSWTSPSV